MDGTLQEDCYQSLPAGDAATSGSDLYCSNSRTRALAVTRRCDGFSFCLVEWIERCGEGRDWSYPESGKRGAGHCSSFHRISSWRLTILFTRLLWSSSCSSSFTNIWLWLWFTASITPAKRTSPRNLNLKPKDTEKVKYIFYFISNRRNISMKNSLICNIFNGDLIRGMVRFFVRAGGGTS